MAPSRRTSRWYHSELFQWFSVLGICAAYTIWLWHLDTRPTQRFLEGWGKRVLAYVPGSGALKRRTIRTAAIQGQDTMRAVSHVPVSERAVQDAVARIEGVQRDLSRAQSAGISEIPQQAVADSVSGLLEEQAGAVEPNRPVNSPQQGAASFEDGLRFFWGGDHRGATRAFQLAASHVPDDPSYRYFLALSQSLAGHHHDAQRSLEQATALEASHSAPGLGRLLERVQGPHRIWMESARRKALVGPYRPRS